MISDSSLYTLAIFLGSAAMLMIVLYHFLEVNARGDDSHPSPGGVGEDDEKVKLKGEKGNVGGGVSDVTKGQVSGKKGRR
jgi:hypothetical protein